MFWIVCCRTECPSSSILHQRVEQVLGPKWFSSPVLWPTWRHQIPWRGEQVPWSKWIPWRWDWILSGPKCSTKRIWRNHVSTACIFWDVSRRVWIWRNHKPRAWRASQSLRHPRWFHFWGQGVQWPVEEELRCHSGHYWHCSCRDDCHPQVLLPLPWYLSDQGQ